MNRIDFYNEQRLRENIRRAIKISLNERKAASNKAESRLRLLIKSLVQEGSEDARHDNTGMNALDDMLQNTNILSTLETHYKKLTTAKEQRESFRTHIINAIVNALAPERAEGPRGGLNNDDDATLAELFQRLAEVEVSLGNDPEAEVEAAAQRVDPIDLGPGREDEEEEVSDQEAFATGLDGDFDKTGRNFALRAWNTVEKSLLPVFQDLGNEEDRSIFYDYLITNIKLYFDRWEEELGGMPEEPSTPEYEEEVAQQNSDSEEINDSIEGEGGDEWMSELGLEDDSAPSEEDLEEL